MHRRRFMGHVAANLALLGCARAGIAAPPRTGGPRFSCMLWTLEKEESFDRSLQTVAEAGYQGIELTGESARWSAAERARILASMHAHSLVFDAMSGVRAGFAVPEETAAFFGQFADHLRAARELSCPQVILLSGRRVEGMTSSAQRAVAVENLKRAAEMAAREHIEIVIEPIDLLEDPGIFLATVRDGFEIASSVDAPNLKVLYDFYHEQRSFGNLLEKLELNLARVGLIHIADVPGRHEPGTGEIDFGRIYGKLSELGYDRWIAMEYYPTAEPVASLRQARVDALHSFRQH